MRTRDKSFFGILVSTAVFFTFHTGITAGESRPDWVDSNGRSSRYPELSYITGYGIGEQESPQKRQSTARYNALSSLSSQFIVKIKSEFLSIQKSTTGSGYSNDIQSMVSSQTQLHLLNTETVTWDDPQHNRCFALAVMEIAPTIRIYASRYSELMEAVEKYAEAARSAEQKRDLKQAVAVYRKVRPLLAELSESRVILSCLEKKSPFPAVSDSAFHPPLSPEAVDLKIQNLLREEITTVQNCATSLSEQIAEQYQTSRPLIIYPLSYRNTDFSSPFSDSFLSMLEMELTAHFQIISEKASHDQKLEDIDMLTGTYWVENDQVRISVYISNLYSGEKRAAATITAPCEIFRKAKMDLLPANFIQAMEDSKVFSAGDILPSSLSIEVWTEKGDKRLLYKSGESTSVFVRVNKPCYLQITYHLANSARVLLYNNLYIDISKINRVVTLPDSFHIVPPFGVERLHIFASTEKFDEVRTHEQTFGSETYTNVLDANMEEYTMNLRGIQKKKTGPQVSERGITITTVP